MARPYTKAEIAEKKRVDTEVADKLAARASGKQPVKQKKYPVGINMLGAFHKGFRDLYDALSQ